jgi:hypothetical protein
MVRGAGRVALAAVLLFVGGVLDIIYGVAAIRGSDFFPQHTTFILSNLDGWGWFMLIVGILAILASLSLIGAGTFGRWFGIVVGGLNAIGALLSISAYPLWSIAIFALSLWIIHGLAIYMQPGPGEQTGSA